MKITTRQALRDLYAQPKARAVQKQLDHLDPHCRHFITLAPFAVLASAGGAGSSGGSPTLDASPRGGEPGFVRVLDAHTVLIPDSPGNNRLDTLENIITTGRLGVLFLIPGVDETLRVNGAATLSTAPDHLALFAGTRRPPVLVIELRVEEAYLHCAKALMRSALWRPESQIARSVLPTMGEMINSQTGTVGAPETQAQMLARYADDL